MKRFDRGLTGQPSPFLFFTFPRRLSGQDLEHFVIRRGDAATDAEGEDGRVGRSIAVLFLVLSFSFHSKFRKKLDFMEGWGDVCRTNDRQRKKRTKLKQSWRPPNKHESARSLTPPPLPPPNSYHRMFTAI